jgi:hypothetical protein
MDVYTVRHVMHQDFVSPGCLIIANTFAGGGLVSEKISLPRTV